MAYSHRNGDSRACGATTIVDGQVFVKVDGQLWAVNGDNDTHGGGALSTTHTWLTIAGKGVIVQGDPAAADDLCPIAGGAHCAPAATGFDNLIDVINGSSAGASFTGSILGTSLTASSVSGNIAAGQSLTGAGVAPGTTIISGSGNSWLLNIAQTIAAVAMTSSYPTAGTKISDYCVGFDKYTKYTDGRGGSYGTLTEKNSSYCGYVPPVPYPLAGTLLSTTCVGVDKHGTYADGKGSTYDALIQANSPDCGYVPPIPVNYTLSIGPKPIAYILIIGQSNIGNYPINTDSYTPTNSVQRMTISGGWESAVSPAGDNRLATGYNWSTGSYQEKPGGPSGGNLDGRIGDSLINSGAYSAVKIVNISVGGTSLGWWLSTASSTAYSVRGEDNFPYTQNKLYERIQFAMNQATSKGFAFTHVLLDIGEQDNILNTSSTQYQAYFSQFKTDLINLGITAPIYMSETSYVPAGFNATNSAAITAGQTAAVILYPNYVFAGPNTDAYNNNYRWDQLHWNVNGLNSLGGEWAYAMLHPSQKFLNTTTVYSFSATANSLNPGMTLTITINSNPLTNSTVYWNNIGTTTASDFTDNTNTGAATLVNGVGTIIRTLSYGVTGSNKTIIIQLLTDSVTGTVVATTTTITVNI